MADFIKGLAVVKQNEISLLFLIDGFEKMFFTENTSKGYVPVVGRVRAFTFFVERSHISILPD